MAEPNLSPALIQFIRAMFPSYDAAVVLIHVSREPSATWGIERLVASIGPESIGLSAVRQHLEHFVRVGLVVEAPQGEFQLSPSSEETRGVILELVLAYDERPVTLVRALDSAARARIQSFADAFRLKRD